MIHPQSAAMWRFFVAAPLTAKFGSSGAAAVRFRRGWRAPVAASCARCATDSCAVQSKMKVLFCDAEVVNLFLQTVSAVKR